MSTGTVAKSSSNEAALQLLGRLRAIRDCWADPYMIIKANNASEESDSRFLLCDSEYALRLAEAQAAVSDASSSVDSPAVTREAMAAIAVFKDLDTLRQLFNSRPYFILGTVRVSDIYPIAHKYNITYQENWTSKEAIYRQMTPHRRGHIDRLAALIQGTPSDPNPTLTSAQADAALDDLTWSRAASHMTYEWYLGRYPQGRHAGEARDSISRKNEIRKERDNQLERTREELESTTRKVLEAYVHGDKTTYGRFLSSRFPSREIYIARLKPQPEVVSFEIKDFQIERYNTDGDLYRAKMNVHYKSILNKERNYHNSILYLKSERGWEIVEWHSP
jgi:hypothetical protein